MQNGLKTKAGRSPRPLPTLHLRAHLSGLGHPAGLSLLTHNAVAASHPGKPGECPSAEQPLFVPTPEMQPGKWGGRPRTPRWPAQQTA